MEPTNKNLTENKTLIPENETSSSVFLDYKHFDEAAAVISFLLFFTIIILNTVVIVVLIIRMKKKKNRLYYLVVNLAVADLLVGLVCVLGDGIQSAMYGAYHGGDILCRLWRFGKFVTTIASNNILIAMSLNRYLAIRYPLKTGRSRAFRYLDKTFVFGAWLLSLIVSSFALPFSKGVSANPSSENPNDDIGICRPDLPWHMLKTYIMVAAFVIYILPTIGVTLCYVGICIVIWRKWKAGLQLFETSRDASNDRLQEDRPSNTGLLPKAKLRSIKMTLVICIAFFVCWTPYFINVLMDVYSPHLITDRRFLVPFGMLYPLNSAINPVIFILFNLQLFRQICEREDGPSATSYEAVSTQVTST